MDTVQLYSTILCSNVVLYNGKAPWNSDDAKNGMTLISAQSLRYAMWGIKREWMVLSHGFLSYADSDREQMPFYWATILQIEWCDGVTRVPWHLNFICAATNFDQWRLLQLDTDKVLLPDIGSMFILSLLILKKVPKSFVFRYWNLSFKNKCIIFQSKVIIFHSQEWIT